MSLSLEKMEENRKNDKRDLQKEKLDLWRWYQTINITNNLIILLISDTLSHDS